MVKLLRPIDVKFSSTSTVLTTVTSSRVNTDDPSIIKVYQINSALRFLLWNYSMNVGHKYDVPDNIITSPWACGFTPTRTSTVLKGRAQGHTIPVASMRE